MAVLRINICKTDREWKKINNISNGKVTAFISRELSRLYDDDNQTAPCLCVEKTQKKKREFAIRLPEKIIERIRCEAELLKIDPATLIVVKILNPRINEPIS